MKRKKRLGKVKRNPTNTNSIKNWKGVNEMIDKKELIKSIYDNLLDSDCLNIEGYESEELKEMCIEIIEKNLKDYVLLKEDMIIR